MAPKDQSKNISKFRGGVVIEGDFCRNTQNPIGQKRYVLGRQNTGVFLCIFTSI